MALIYKQTVVQEASQGVQQRMIVQYCDDVTGEDKQVIVDYADLTTEEKSTFDAYKALCESKMV